MEFPKMEFLNKELLMAYIRRSDDLPKMKNGEIDGLYK